MGSEADTACSCNNLFDLNMHCLMKQKLQLCETFQFLCDKTRLHTKKTLSPRKLSEISSHLDLFLLDWTHLDNTRSAALDILFLKCRRQGLDELVSLVLFLNEQGVEVPRAADLELGQTGYPVDLHFSRVFTTRELQKLTDLGAVMITILFYSLRRTSLRDCVCVCVK